MVTRSRGTRRASGGAGVGAGAGVSGGFKPGSSANKYLRASPGTDSDSYSYTHGTSDDDGQEMLTPNPTARRSPLLDPTRTNKSGSSRPNSRGSASSGHRLRRHSTDSYVSTSSAGTHDGTGRSGGHTLAQHSKKGGALSVLDLLDASQREQETVPDADAADVQGVLLDTLLHSTPASPRERGGLPSSGAKGKGKRKGGKGKVKGKASGEGDGESEEEVAAAAVARAKPRRLKQSQKGHKRAKRTRKKPGRFRQAMQEMRGGSSSTVVVSGDGLTGIRSSVVTGAGGTAGGASGLFLPVRGACADGDTMLQFGRLDSNTFFLDFSAPLASVQAFALGLCQFLE